MSHQKLFDKTATFQILPDGTNYKGSYGEIIIDLTLPGLRIMDGCTCGGLLQIPAELTDCAAAAEAALAGARAASEEKVAAAAKKLAVSKLEE